MAWAKRAIVMAMKRAKTMKREMGSDDDDVEHDKNDNKDNNAN
jgi:hypothetical protein